MTGSGVAAHRQKPIGFISESRERIVHSPSLRVPDDSNSKFVFRNHQRNLPELFNTRTHSYKAYISFPVVSWANMCTMENRVLIHVNPFLGKYRDKRLQSQQAVPTLSGILRACPRHIGLLLEVQ